MLEDIDFFEMDRVEGFDPEEFAILFYGQEPFSE